MSSTPAIPADALERLVVCEIVLDSTIVTGRLGLEETPEIHCRVFAVLAVLRDRR